MDITVFTHKLLDAASEAGIDKCEVYAAEGDSFFVNITGGQPEKYNVSGHRGVSLRVEKDGRMGYCSTTAADESSIAFLINGALENLSVLETEDKQYFYSGSDEYPQADGWSDELAAVTTEEKLALARRLEAEALGGEIKKVFYAAVGTGSDRIIIMNSNGLELRSDSNYIYAYLIPIAERDGRQSDGSAFACGRSLSDINAVSMRNKSVSEAVAWLDCTQPATGVFNIFLSPDAMCDLLAAFSSVFSADSAQKGLSLMAGKEGQPVASSAVTLTDCPFRKDAPSLRTFDDEGCPAFAKTVINGGVLKTLLHNLKTARKAGCQSTGNGFKASFASGISVIPSNMCIEPSAMKPEHLYAMAGNGILICDLAGLHSGANSLSGDFSLGAKGFLIKDGRPAGGVSGITVSGNFYHLLKGIVAVADDLSWGAPGTSAFGSPTVFAGMLSIAGK